jgi:hypothetical protein
MHAVAHLLSPLLLPQLLRRLIEMALLTLLTAEGRAMTKVAG